MEEERPHKRIQGGAKIQGVSTTPTIASHVSDNAWESVSSFFCVLSLLSAPSMDFIRQTQVQSMFQRSSHGKERCYKGGTTLIIVIIIITIVEPHTK